MSEAAAKNGNVTPEHELWTVIGSETSQYVEKTTSAMNVWDGCIVRVTHKIGENVTEALVNVPKSRVVPAKEHTPAHLVTTVR